MFPVIVVYNSQEDGHEEVGVDHYIGYEEQGIPPTEVKCWHPRGEENGFSHLIVDSESRASYRAIKPLEQLPKCCLSYPDVYCS